MCKYVCIPVLYNLDNTDDLAFLTCTQDNTDKVWQTARCVRLEIIAPKALNLFEKTVLILLINQLKAGDLIW